MTDNVTYEDDFLVENPNPGEDITVKVEYLTHPGVDFSGPITTGAYRPKD